VSDGGVKAAMRLVLVSCNREGHKRDGDEFRLD